MEKRTLMANPLADIGKELLQEGIRVASALPGNKGILIFK
jgi:hypothetical protein